MPAGLRLRQRRREQGVTQAALASSVGISASYLNLIEHGKREVAGALLRRLAEALDVEVAALTGHEDLRLAEELAELAADPVLHDLALDQNGAQEIVARRPDWARAIVRLNRRYQAASRLAETLSQRLAHDATLVEASHELLTRLTTVRSFAEILQEHEDVEPERRDRYVRQIAVEGARLGDVAKSVFDRLSDFDESLRPSTPAEEVDDFLVDHAHHFPELERRAEALAPSIRAAGGGIEAALVERLADRHDIRIETGGADDATALRRPTFDSAARVLRLPLGLADPTRRFQLARLVFALEEREAILASVEDPRLASPAARQRARDALSSYGAGALLLPYDAFRDAAEAARYDIDHLAGLFGASTEQVCHRLVTLRRPGAEGVPFAFLRIDPAGNISKRFGLPGLRLPSFGGVCPLWAIYASLRTAGTIVTQRVRLPEGREFLFVARTVVKPPPAFEGVSQTFSIMIACEVIHAASVVYGDTLSAASRSAIRTGINCHLCPQDDCPQRAYPQVLPAG